MDFFCVLPLGGGKGVGPSTPHGNTPLDPGRYSLHPRSSDALAGVFGTFPEVLEHPLGVFHGMSLLRTKYPHADVLRDGGKTSRYERCPFLP